MTRNVLAGAAFLAALAWPAAGLMADGAKRSAADTETAADAKATECARKCCIEACVAGSEPRAAAVKEKEEIEEDDEVEEMTEEDLWDDEDYVPPRRRIILSQPAKECTVVRWNDRTRCNRRPNEVTHHFSVTNRCGHDIRAHWVPAGDAGAFPVTAPAYTRTQILTVGESAEDRLSCLHAGFQPRLVICSEYNDPLLRKHDSSCRGVPDS